MSVSNVLNLRNLKFTAFCVFFRKQYVWISHALTLFVQVLRLVVYYIRWKYLTATALKSLISTTHWIRFTTGYLDQGRIKMGRRWVYHYTLYLLPHLVDETARVISHFLLTSSFPFYGRISNLPVIFIVHFFMHEAECLLLQFGNKGIIKE